MRYFIIQVDRCFKTGLYGEGNEIHIEEPSKAKNYINTKYGIIKSAKYTESGSLVVQIKYPDSDILENITLDCEPDQELFENTLYKDWQLWDKNYGIYDENRSDYEPWSFNSLKSLAIELNCLEAKDDEKIKLYWNKPYATNS